MTEVAKQEAEDALGMIVGDQRTVIAGWPGRAEFEGGAVAAGEDCYGAKQRSEASALIGGAQCGGRRP